MRSKSTGAEREKSGRHKPLQCRRAQPGRDQSGRRPRRWLGERHGTMPGGRNTREWQFFKHSGPMKAGASHDRHHPTIRSEDCDMVHRRLAGTRGALRVLDGRITVDVDRSRVEAAGSDYAVDRNFSVPAGVRTDRLRAGDASEAVGNAHKKHRRLKKEGGNLLRGIPPMHQKLCSGFAEYANEIDRRDTRYHGSSLTQKITR